MRLDDFDSTFKIVVQTPNRWILVVDLEVQRAKRKA